jgi:predicted RNA-binding Zn ribbon-like protein
MSTNTIAPDAVLAAGLTLMGEPLSIDLANTEKLASETPRELLADEDAHRAFWALERGRVSIPDQLPALDDVRALRCAVRSLLESRIDHRAADPLAVDSVNRFASAAPISLHLEPGWTSRTESHAHDDAAALLGEVARSAIEVLTGPDADRLHRCASDTCSMLFVATNARRQWCTAAGCGNRQRVARHASRQRGAQATQLDTRSAH